MAEEEEEYFNQNTQIPIYLKSEERSQHKTQNKQVLLNLGVFALLTAISSLVFMGWLSKKTREDDIKQSTILPFHNPLDRSQLLCPLNTSFDTSRFSCVECSDNCEYCYHEYRTRCIQCVHPYKLYQDECIEDCISIDNVCVNTSQELLGLYNYTVVDLGTELRINQLFQVEIHTHSSDNIYIIFPPLGQSFNYFQDSLKLPELAQTLNATIFVFSTPYTEVLQIQEVEDLTDPEFEEYRYVERVGNYAKTYFTEKTKAIKIIAFGEMLIFAHELATMIVKQSACVEGNVTVVLMQNKAIQLFETLNISYIKLQHLLAYIDQEWDISHKENKSNLMAQNENDLAASLERFILSLSFNKLIRPSINMKIDVVVISERGSRDIQYLYEDGFNAKSFRQLYLDNDHWSAFFSKLVGLQ